MYLKNIFFKIIFLTICIFCTYCGHNIVYDVAKELEESESFVDAKNSELKIFIVNVGQGDATLVLGPEVDGEQISLLIDAGGLEPDGGAILYELFQQQNLSQLNHLILTHYDGDHMGGLVTLWGTSTSILWDENCIPTNFFPTDSMIDLGESEKNTKSVQEYLSCRNANLDLLQSGHIPIVDHLDQTIDMGGGYVATIVAGNGFVIDQIEPVANVDTDNEKSIAVLIQGPNDFTFLVTGDLIGEAYGNEDALVEVALGEALKNRGIDVSILRVGHHGSANASSSAFLQAIQPEVSIISVGDNSHGHPHCEVLERLAQYSNQIIQTGGGQLDETCLVQNNVDVIGETILVVVDNGNYTIN